MGFSLHDPSASAASPRRAMPETPDTRSRLLDEAAAFGPLQWYPKPLTVGDMDGTGAQKMLGRASNVSAAEVLVRETAQNSWDACASDTRMSFELHLRRATDEERKTLREDVFTGPSAALNQIAVGQSLSKRELWLLEVNDRDTKGLGGPTTNTQRAKPGQPTNYRDFVLNLGSPRDEHLGGGTYGFGKTASYGASECGAIVMWSRSEEGQSLEHRFIASAMTPSFTYRDRPYTGRHWWGLRGEEDPILPLQHMPAAELGARLFRRWFERYQTGTSLLIIDPKFDGATPQQFARQLAGAALKNLWPKLHPDTTRTFMDIRVLYEGQEIPLGTPSEHPILQHFATALQMVRDVQGGGSPKSAFAHVAEPFSGQPVGAKRTALGQLVLIPFPTPDSSTSPFEDEWPMNHVCYMRHRAELVVRYAPFPAHHSDGISWVGVFKPAEEADDAFADSEPPTHDDWTVQGVSDRTLKSIVNISLKRIREEVKAWLSPTSPDGGRAAQSHPAAVLANALSGLVPQADGQRVTPKEGRKPGSAAPRKARPSAVIEEYILGPIFEGLQEWAFKVEFQSPRQSDFLLTPQLAIATVDKPDSDVEGLMVFGWDSTDTLPNFELEPEHRTVGAYFENGASLWLRALAPAGLAMQVSFNIEEPDDGNQ